MIDSVAGQDQDRLVYRKLPREQRLSDVPDVYERTRVADAAPFARFVPLGEKCAIRGFTRPAIETIGEPNRIAAEWLTRFQIDDAVVGSVTATWQLRPELNLFASYGTAFRAPSIVERLFNGLTPEGAGYQLLNPDLASESSDNVDLGIKYRRADAFLELVVFVAVLFLGWLYVVRKGVLEWQSEG